MGGTFDFRVTPNPNLMLDVNLDVEFDNETNLFDQFFNLLRTSNKLNFTQRNLFYHEKDFQQINKNYKNNITTMHNPCAMKIYIWVDIYF